MTQNLFSDLEGLRIAMEIEDRGREFYRQAYEWAVKPEHKELFMFLMTEEKHHYATFAKLFETIQARKEAQSGDYLFDADTSRYLTVLAEGHIFPPAEKMHEKIAQLTTIEAILVTALQAEKDSVLFYDELAANAKFEDARKVFAALKEEEKKHILKLREMIDAWA